MSLFTPSPQQIADLVVAYPLAWIVSANGAERAATPLPLLGELDGDGAVVSLFGHFARSNPQVALLERDPHATILFQGPNGYISPQLVSNPTWGPTWNYAVARFDTELRFVPEETEASVERLAEVLEGGGEGAWRPNRMGPRYAELAKRIVAFRASVRSVTGRFKLGQDEKRETFEEIIAGLADSDLARWMTAAARRT